MGKIIKAEPTDPINYMIRAALYHELEQVRENPLSNLITILDVMSASLLYLVPHKKNMEKSGGVGKLSVV